MVKRGVNIECILKLILITIILSYPIQLISADSLSVENWEGRLTQKNQNILQDNIAKYNPNMVLKEFANSEEKNQTYVDVTIRLDDSINRDNFVTEFSNEEFKDVVNRHIPNKSSNSFSVKISEETFFKLLKDERVKIIDYNAPVHWFLDDSAPLINANGAWNLGYTGDGVKICIIDSGIDSTHFDLSARIVDEKCYCSSSEDYLESDDCCPDGTNEDDYATDYNGHGTHVTGIVASEDSTYKGIAYGANLYIVKTQTDLNLWVNLKVGKS